MVVNAARLRRNELDHNVSYEEYHPYGTTAWQAPSLTTVSLKRYKYTGMERDEETGLQRHGVRYYAAWLGRWTSADPIGLGDGVNRFGYCRGRVVRAVDTSGLGMVNDPGPAAAATDGEESRRSGAARGTPRKPAAAHEVDIPEGAPGEAAGQEYLTPREVLASGVDAVMNSRMGKTIAFGVTHPVAALDIGLAFNPYSQDATRVALNFSSNLDLPSEKKSNAVRHAIWQGLITSGWGAKIAKGVGDAHEVGPTPEAPELVHFNQTDADTAVDLLNNALIRERAPGWVGLSAKDIAGLVLDIQNSEGLWEWRYDADSGSYTVGRHQLEDSDFKAAKDRLGELDEYGVPPDEFRASDMDWEHAAP